jgi:Right handed beta helix region
MELAQDGLAPRGKSADFPLSFDAARRGLCAPRIRRRAGICSDSQHCARLVSSMPKSLFSLAFLALFTATASQPSGSRTYYVDSITGNDANSGLSATQPWKSLDKVNATTFGPGDRILVKAGTAYNGQLRPQGSGNAQSPIVIDMFGQGEKPLIAAQGNFHEALLLKNQEYWEVGNLQFSNMGPAREPFRYGVRVMSWDYGAVHHIHLKNLFVHDVNGSLIKKDAGEGHGIVWENGGDKVRSRFDGLLIENCHLVRTDRNGICGYVPYRDKKSLSAGVIIRKNLLEDIGGDAIKVWGCDRALVEYNTVRGARMRCDDYAAGIWPWSSDNTVIQFNEVSGVKGTKDGEAFDSDGFSTNTTFQYNYSHDNDGGFMLICCKDSIKTVVRYNISQNDHTRLFHMGGPIKDIAIYNNVFYVGKGIGLDLFLWQGDGKDWAEDTTVSNNIFYIDGTASNAAGTKRKPVDDGTFFTQPGVGGATKVTFRNNLFFGNFKDVPAEWQALQFDPLLSKPGSGGQGLGSLQGYRLRKGSKSVGAGVPIAGNGGRDFWGNAVPAGKNPAVGVHEQR